MSNAMRRKALFALPCLVLLFTNCGTRTVVGGYSDSPDGEYRVYARLYGAYGRAYDDKTSKSVVITLTKKGNEGSPLLKRSYRFTGSSARWDANWQTNGELTVVVFDYGIGTDRVDGARANLPKRQLLSVSFQLKQQGPHLSGPH
jgi:hypothetical protein